jgi:hypothetical protein
MIFLFDYIGIQFSVDGKGEINKIMNYLHEL